MNRQLLPNEQFERKRTAPTETNSSNGKVCMQVRMRLAGNMCVRARTVLMGHLAVIYCGPFVLIFEITVVI